MEEDTVVALPRPGSGVMDDPLLRQIAGAEAEVDVAWEDDLDPPPTIKFRAVELSVERAKLRIPPVLH